jgi:GH15 family glucan-1,4-alpha-glucosidase
LKRTSTSSVYLMVLIAEDAILSVNPIARGAVDSVVSLRIDLEGRGSATACNSWFISSLWFAGYLIRKAAAIEELEEAEKMLEWVVEHAFLRESWPNRSIP